MSKKPEITFDTIDAHGYMPDATKIGSRWIHSGNLHTYTIVGFHWNGENDTWMYAHTREGSYITYLRSPANFHGTRMNAQGTATARYSRVG